MLFCLSFPADVQLRVNANGGVYDNGRSLPVMYRDRILDLHHNGFSNRRISLDLRVSNTYVDNVVKQYNSNNTSLRAPKHTRINPKVDQAAAEYIEVERLLKPSIYASEIKQRLLLDGVSHPNDLPSISQINKISRNKQLMTRKVITSIPKESTSNDVTQKVDDYMAQVTNFNSYQLHFFDESSVIKTTGNRRYGSALIGEPAFEVQRYASNANYTINLLHSINGPDFFNILDGPSNGVELLLFFEEAVSLERIDGSAVLERGDCVVMDNCGFHHGRMVEPVLRGMLADFGVNLLFQPPYSPDFNTCESCFNQVKAYLRKNQLLAEHETKIAIADAILQITPQNSFQYFKHIGYIL